MSKQLRLILSIIGFSLIGIGVFVHKYPWLTAVGAVIFFLAGLKPKKRRKR